MYPERKKSASVKKNMQMLQKLIGHDDNKAIEEIDLFNRAIKSARKRVVVKRPKGAPTLTNKKPTMTIESKITRYDVYVLT
jgi:16S rRNA (guanine1516-N2)-methyltransferase